MAKKNISLSEQEIQMIERLRGRPALSKRFEAILDLCESEQGAVKTADEIEALLREKSGVWDTRPWSNGPLEPRTGLGRNTRRVIRGATAQKKRLNWWCVFGQIEIEERIWRTATSSYERVFAPRIADRAALKAKSSPGTS